MTTCFKDDIWAMPRYRDQRIIHMSTAECQAFSPVVRIGSAHPFTRRRVWPPPLVPGGGGGGGGTLACWKGWALGGLNSDEGTLVLWVCPSRNQIKPIKWRPLAKKIKYNSLWYKSLSRLPREMWIQIRIFLGNWIRIRFHIKVESWIRFASGSKWKAGSGFGCGFA